MIAQFARLIHRTDNHRVLDPELANGIIRCAKGGTGLAVLARDPNHMQTHRCVSIVQLVDGRDRPSAGATPTPEEVQEDQVARQRTDRLLVTIQIVNASILQTRPSESEFRSRRPTTTRSRRRAGRSLRWDGTHREIIQLQILRGWQLQVPIGGQIERQRRSRLTLARRIVLRSLRRQWARPDRRRIPINVGRLALGR